MASRASRKIPSKNQEIREFQKEQAFIRRELMNGCWFEGFEQYYESYGGGESVIFYPFDLASEVRDKDVIIW